VVVISEQEIIFIEKSMIENLLSQFKRSIGITRKDLRMYIKKFPIILQAVLFPIILFFAFTTRRSIPPVFIVSGLGALILFMASTAIAPLTLPWETLFKNLEKIITTPISIKTILIGDIIASILFSTIISFIPLILGLLLFSLWISVDLVGLLIVILGILLASFAFSCFSALLSVPPTTHPSSTMILTITIKFPIIMISPLFMAIEPNSIALLSPLTYFLDILNYGITGVSIFGVYGILIDFGILSILGIICLLLSFRLHELTLQKRF